MRRCGDGPMTFMRRSFNILIKTFKEALADYLFLYRSHEALRPFLDRHGSEAVLPKTEQATQADFPRLLALVRQHEGEASAKVLTHWLQHQPEGAWLIRGDDGQVSAFTFIARLDHSSEAAILKDPVTRTIWEYLLTEGSITARRRGHG